MRRRRGFTVVEVLIGVVLTSVIIGIIYGTIHLFFGSKSRSNIANLTKRSFLQKDAKSGVRRLLYRLREGIQILNPTPGTSSNELHFRDISNLDVRLRLIPEEKTVVTERMVSGAWVREVQPEMVPNPSGTHKLPVSWPVMIPNVISIRFTSLAPDCVTVQASLEMEGQVTPLLTVIKLRNAGMAY